MIVFRVVEIAIFCYGLYSVIRRRFGAGPDWTFHETEARILGGIFMAELPASFVVRLVVGMAWTVSRGTPEASALLSAGLSFALLVLFAGAAAGLAAWFRARRG